MAFLATVFRQLAANSIDGSIHYVCMDWRHPFELLSAGRVAYGEFKNLSVWRKSCGCGLTNPVTRACLCEIACIWGLLSIDGLFVRGGDSVANQTWEEAPDLSYPLLLEVIESSQ